MDTKDEQKYRIATAIIQGISGVILVLILIMVIWHFI